MVLFEQVCRIYGHDLFRPSQENGPNYGPSFDPPQRDALLLLVGRQVLARGSRDLLFTMQHVHPRRYVQLLLAGRYGTKVSEISLVEKVSYFTAAGPVYHHLGPQSIGSSFRM